MQRLGHRVAWGVASLVILWPGFAYADPLTGSSSEYVSIGVGDTTMTILGQSSPGAFITIADFGQVIGTTAADSAGQFSITFPAQRPEIHKPSVFARDSDGVYTDTVTIPTSLYEHFDTQVYFFLPPTLSTTVGQVVRGNSFPVTGQTVPGATINLMLDSNQPATALADGTGHWQFQWDTTGIAYGTHRLFAFATDTSNQSSYPSHALTYQVVSGIVGLPAPSPIPLPAPQPSSAPGSSHAPLRVYADIPPALIPVSETRFPVRVQGGQGPYRVGIDWGDGHLEEIVLDGSEAMVSHHFDKPGLYNAFVYAIDANGTLQRVPVALRVQSLLAVINNGLQLLLLLLLAIFLLEHTLREDERRELRRYRRTITR